MQNYIGQHIDRYRITERLGTGGMAVVYKAYDTRLERDVALKLIRTEAIPPQQYDRLMKRFEREAKAQARFDHKHIVHVYDYGEVQGAPYLVMSYVPGGTLKEKTGQPVDYRQAIQWLLPVADALSYAHQRGVIHRDIKPSNILIDEEGQPVLTDFGIAKILETDEATLTGTGLGVGTPEYMAPEQWQGKAMPATDQYALGVVLYELITGQKPYSADTPAAIILMQATEPLRAPSQLVVGIPEGLEKVLYKALARNPQDRYEDMAAFQGALGAVLDESEALEPVPVVKRTP
jgi:eukaryotic-like serine/threonine-protein kinase